MTTALEHLTRLCPPPPAPSSVDWNSVETALGMALPKDYRQLASRYGPGSFCGYLSLRHPLGMTDWIDLTGPMTTQLRNQLEDDRARGRSVPYAPQDLFPIAVTDNGEFGFWHTAPAQDPAAWTIAVNEARGAEWFTFDGTLTEFLVAVLSGRTRVPLFPDSLLSRGPFFTPSPERRAGQEPSPAAPRRPARGPRDSAAVRAWAREHGYDVPERGRIPAAVLTAWEEAHDE
ncbi:histone-like nucleoid-structuring protein Lsr2 [Streptomyces sp. NPDC006552]|uniref:Lsr2 family DNA-binding protein n=1 Tax=Streptomyces sp. NPDC006552 TaxID=3157179 RepID=UPI0033AA4530